MSEVPVSDPVPADPRRFGTKASFALPEGYAALPIKISHWPVSLPPKRATVYRGCRFIGRDFA